MDLELLADSILAHWKHFEIDKNSLVLNELNRIQGQTQKGFAYYY